MDARLVASRGTLCSNLPCTSRKESGGSLGGRFARGRMGVADWLDTFNAYSAQVVSAVDTTHRHSAGDR